MNGSKELIDVRILKRREQGEGIISLDLAATEGNVLPPFEAGAHVDLHVGGLIRQYSLCGDPAEGGIYRLGILLETGGRGGSAAVHREFLEGQQVRISAPRNSFKLVEDAVYSVLLAGGIGVTPMLAMAHRLHALGRRFELHYCTRSHGRTAFTGDIAEASFALHVHVHHDDGPAAQRFDPANTLAVPRWGVHLYVCGPKGFMDWIMAGAKAQGWPDLNIHREYFSAEVSGTGDAFTVEARLSGRTIVVSAGQSIAAALVKAGIAIPLSCEQGVCGTCLVDVIEGTPDHRDMFQTDEEKASNRRITPCCSRSLSSKLVLEI